MSNISPNGADDVMSPRSIFIWFFVYLKNTIGFAMKVPCLIDRVLST